MSILQLTTPPELGPKAKYPQYKDWLLENFYLDLCSYCLQQYRDALSIDHYVPQSCDEEGIHDPENLLLSCQNCGRQKSDYHPDHDSRRRLRDESRGFLVLDVRRDDLARIFEMKLRLVEQLRAVDGELTDLEQRALDILETDLAERLPMLQAFDIALTPELRERLKQLVRDRVPRSST